MLYRVQVAFTLILAACPLVRGWIGWNYEHHSSFTSIVSHHGNGAIATHAMNACFADVSSSFLGSGFVSSMFILKPQVHACLSRVVLALASVVLFEERLVCIGSLSTARCYPAALEYASIATSQGTLHGTARRKLCATIADSLGKDVASNSKHPAFLLIIASPPVFVAFVVCL